MRNAMFIQPIIDTLLKNREYEVSILACVSLSSVSIQAKLNALLTAKTAQHVFTHMQITRNEFYRPSLLIQVQELFFCWQLWLFFLSVPSNRFGHFSRAMGDIVLFQPIRNGLQSSVKHVCNFLIREMIFMNPFHKIISCWLLFALSGQTPTRETHFHSIRVHPTKHLSFAHSIQCSDFAACKVLSFIQILKDFTFRFYCSNFHFTSSFCAYYITKDRCKSSVLTLG